jgi:hypothetical protein
MEQVCTTHLRDIGALLLAPFPETIFLSKKGTQLSKEERAAQMRNAIILMFSSGKR